MRSAWIAAWIAAGLPLLLSIACSRAPVVTPAENTESALTATISRDGKYLAYTTGNILVQNLRVRDLTGGGEREIFTPGMASYEHLRISPDNRYLYFSGLPWALYRVPLEGGTAQRVIAGKNAACSFSPDGSRMLLAIDGKLSIVNIADNSAVPLTVSVPPGRLHLPAWSPDGSIYAFVLESPDSGLYLYTLPAGISQTWVARRLTTESWSSIADIAWLPDNKAMVIAATRWGENAWRLWRIAVPQGTAERIGSDNLSYSSASLAADGRLATVETETTADLWLSPADRPDQTRRIKSAVGQAPGSRGLAWTPDGRLIYTALDGGRVDLWVSATDGYQARKITMDGNNWMPRVTADGQTVIFLSDRSGQAELWRQDMNHGRPRQVTRQAGGLSETLASPDGKWVFDKTGWATWRNTARTGLQTLSPDDHDLWPAVSRAISPNGLLTVVRPPKQAHQVVDASGKVLRELRSGWQVQWTADSRALSYLDEGGGAINLWIQPLNAPSRQLTHFTSGGVVQHTWSPDGRWLAFARSSQRTRVALIANVAGIR